MSEETHPMRTVVEWEMITCFAHLAWHGTALAVARFDYYVWLDVEGDVDT